MKRNRRNKPESTVKPDTLAWLLAAVQLVGPVIMILITVVGIAYGIIYLLFLR